MNADEANEAMIRRVTVPSFFQKVAAEAGYVPADDAEADRLLRLGDVVKYAVDGYLEDARNAGRQATAAAVKAAADAAFEVAGIRTPAAAETPSADFLLDDEVKAAAAAIFDAKVQARLDQQADQTSKQAEHGCAPAAVPAAAPPVKKDADDKDGDDADDKKAAPAA